MTMNGNIQCKHLSARHDHSLSCGLMITTALNLAALSTVASSTARVAVNALEQAGESFAGMFAADSATEASPSDVEPTSFADQLSQWSGKFREWLSSHGIATPFSMKLNVDELGYTEFSIDGQQQQDIAALLEAEPHWKQQFERLARGAQAAASALFSTPVEVHVDQESSRIAYLP